MLSFWRHGRVRPDSKLHRPSQECADGACALPFVNWTLRRAAMDCVRVPPGGGRPRPTGAAADTLGAAGRAVRGGVCVVARGVVEHLSSVKSFHVRVEKGDALRGAGADSLANITMPVTATARPTATSRAAVVELIPGCHQ